MNAQNKIEDISDETLIRDSFPGMADDEYVEIARIKAKLQRENFPHAAYALANRIKLLMSRPAK